MKVTEEILEDAKNWYLQGNSIRKVASLIFEKFGVKVGKETARKYLSKIVKLRTKKGVMTMKRGNYLDETKVVELYIKNLLSMKQIAKLFNASASGIKWVLVKNKVKIRSKRDGIKIRIAKYEKPIFCGTEIEKAYLIGIVLGDLAVRKTSQFTIEVNTASTHKAMIDLLIDTFSKHTDAVIHYRDKEKGFRFYAYLDKSFDFLLKTKENIGIIKNFDANEFLSFLAGFFDAEGCIVKTIHRKKLICKIKIGNTQKKILEIIKNKLEELDIHSNIFLYSNRKNYHWYKGRKIAYKKPYYMLEINRKKDMADFLHKTNLRHAEKIERKIWASNLLNSSLYAT